MSRFDWDCVGQPMYAFGKAVLSVLWMAFTWILIFFYIDIPIWMIVGSLAIVYVGEAFFRWRQYGKVIK